MRVALQVRLGEEALVRDARRRRDAPACRGRARLRRADRRRLSRAGRRLPRRRDADRARRCRGRLMDRAAAAGAIRSRSPTSSSPPLPAGSEDEGRPDAGTRGLSGPLASALVERGLRGRDCARSSRSSRSTALPCRLSGYDWLVLTSASCVEALFAPARGRAPAGRGHRAGNRGGAPRPRRRAGVVARTVDPGRPAARASPAGRPRALRRRRGRPRRARPRARCRRRPALPDRRATARSGFPTRTSSFSPRPRRRGATRRSEATCPCVSIGPVTSAEAARHGLDVVAEAATHDLDGLVASG